MSVDQINGDLVRLAQRMVCVHAEHVWPHGVFCVNCRAEFPCPLSRWGTEILTIAGWTESSVTRLVLDYWHDGRPAWLTSADL
jgi:hypothetical protein